MRCKKGDLALVIRSHAGNCGKVVTCLEHIKVSEKGLQMKYGAHKFVLAPGDWWRLDRVMNLTYGHEVLVNFAPYGRDEFMIPIGNVDEPIEVKEQEKEPA